MRCISKHAESFFTQLLILTVVTLSIVMATGIAVAQSATLEVTEALTSDVLAAKIYAKTLEEKSYCDYIIQERDAGRLPNKILYSVCNKAVTKSKASRFTYFQTAIEILCKREGIVLSVPKDSQKNSSKGVTPTNPFNEAFSATHSFFQSMLKRR